MGCLFHEINEVVTAPDYNDDFSSPIPDWFWEAKGLALEETKWRQPYKEAKTK